MDLPGPRAGRHTACLLPPDSRRTSGCHTLAPLRLERDAPPTVIEGRVARGTRACWTLRLAPDRRLDLRLMTEGGAAALSTWLDGPSTLPRSVLRSTSTMTSVSRSALRLPDGRTETRLVLGPQRPGGDVVIAVDAPADAALTYRLEARLR